MNSRILSLSLTLRLQELGVQLVFNTYLLNGCMFAHLATLFCHNDPNKSVLLLYTVPILIFRATHYLWDQV